MSYKFEIQQEAIVELQKAYEWYENQRTGLDDELVEEVESSFNAISEYPERYPILGKLMPIGVSGFPSFLILFFMRFRRIR